MQFIDVTRCDFSIFVCFKFCLIFFKRSISKNHARKLYICWKSFFASENHATFNDVKFCWINCLWKYASQHKNKINKIDSSKKNCSIIMLSITFWCKQYNEINFFKFIYSNFKIIKKILSFFFCQHHDWNSNLLQNAKILISRFK